MKRLKEIIKRKWLRLRCWDANGLNPFYSPQIHFWHELNRVFVLRLRAEALALMEEE